ncbi:MAG: tRNA dimethylallyltransferase, partial [Hyphomicrobium sp.]|nr:tRNA dimethylallyltransferase [Hyphomicrobium sp.]
VERIEARFEQMLDEGGLEEARQLKALGLDPSLPVMLALGVGPLLRHLEGELSREEAIAAGRAETRQYAKRQRTWMRGNMIAWKTINAQQMQQSIGDFVSFIRSAH